jgi:hypothetical protein
VGGQKLENVLDYGLVHDRGRRLGISLVSGRSPVPLPAAKITAFTMPLAP